MGAKAISGPSGVVSCVDVWLARQDSNLEPPDPESGALPLSHAPAMPYGEAEFNAQRRAPQPVGRTTRRTASGASHRYATCVCGVVGPFGLWLSWSGGQTLLDSAVEVDAMAGSTATPPGTIGKDSITTIARTMANSYLLRGEQGFVMVDTGLPNRRADIDPAIEDAGCRPAISDWSSLPTATTTTPETPRTPSDPRSEARDPP